VSWEATIWIPELPEPQADVMQRHARARYRKRWHRTVAEVVMVERVRPTWPLTDASIRLTRHCMPKRLIKDYGNLVYSFKAPIDGLVRARVLADDSMTVLAVETYHQQEPDGRGEGIEMQLSELSE
jgi:hypothetical protein